MKYTTRSIPGESRTNERYTVNDNTELANLIISNVHLYRNQETVGHSHDDQDEVYFFVFGQGYMLIDDTAHKVTAGDVILVPHSKFHKVFNTGDTTMIFNTVYNRKHYTTWVDLTDDEIEKAYMDTNSFERMAKVLEAIIKEKNV